MDLGLYLDKVPWGQEMGNSKVFERGRTRDSVAASIIVKGSGVRFR